MSDKLEYDSEQAVEERRLATFIEFVESEAKRIDEENKGAHRRDGGRKMACLLFMRSFLKRATDYLVVTAVKEEKKRIYKRLDEMKSVYETMDTGSALKVLVAEDVMRNEL